MGRGFLDCGKIIVRTVVRTTQDSSFLTVFQLFLKLIYIFSRSDPTHSSVLKELLINFESFLKPLSAEVRSSLDLAGELGDFWAIPSSEVIAFMSLSRSSRVSIDIFSTSENTRKIFLFLEKC